MKKNFKSLTLALLLGSSLSTLNAATDVDGEAVSRGASARAYSEGVGRDEELARQKAETEKYKRLSETLEAIMKRQNGREGADKESTKAETDHYKVLLEVVTRERDNLISALEALASRIIEAASDQRKLSEELERLRDSEARQTALVQDLEARLKVKDEEHSGRLADLTAALTEEQASKAEAIQRLERDLAAKAATVESCSSRLAELEGQLEERMSVIKSLRDNMARLERGKKAVVDKLKATTPEVETLRDNLTRLEREKMAVENKLKAAKSNLETLRDHKVSLERSKKAVEDELRTSQSELETLRNRDDSKSREIDALKVRIRELQEERLAPESSLESLTRERDDLRAALEDAASKRVEVEGALGKLSEELKALRATEMTLRKSEASSAYRFDELNRIFLSDRAGHQRSFNSLNNFLLAQLENQKKAINKAIVDLSAAAKSSSKDRLRVAELEGELLQKRMVITSQEEGLERHQRERDELEGKLKAAQSELEALRRGYVSEPREESAASAVVASKDLLDSVTRERDDLRSALEASASKRVEAESALRELTEELKALRRSEADKNHRLDRLNTLVVTERMEHLKSTISVLNNLVDLLEKQKQEIDRVLRVELASKASETEQYMLQSLDLQGKLIQQGMVNSSQEEELIRLERAKSIAEEELKAAQSELAALRRGDDFEDRPSEPLKDSATLVRVTRERDSLREALEASASKRVVAESALDKLTKELEVLRPSEAGLRKTVEELKRREVDLRTTIRVTADAAESRFAQTNKFFNKELDDYRGWYKQIKDELFAKTAEAEKLRLRVVELEGQLTKEGGASQTLRDNLETLQKEKMDVEGELESLKSQLVTLQSRFDDVLQKNETMERTFEESLRAERETAASELETIHAAVVSMAKPEEELDRLRRILENERNSRLRAERDLAEARSDRTELLTRLAELGFAAFRVEDRGETPAEHKEEPNAAAAPEPERSRAESSGSDSLGNESDVSSDEAPASPALSASSVSSGAGRPSIMSIESLLGMPANPKRQTHFRSMVVPDLVYDLSEVKRGRDSANRFKVAEDNDRLLEKYVRGSKFNASQRRTLNRILSARNEEGRTVQDILDERKAAERRATTA